MPILQRVRYALIFSIVVNMIAMLAIAIVSAFPQSIVRFESGNVLFHPLYMVAFFSVAYLVAPALARRIQIQRTLGRSNTLSIESDTAESLAVRDGQVLTLFDPKRRLVRQNGRPVTLFSAIQEVRLTQATRAGPTTWEVALQLRDSRRIVVGASTDDSLASSLAARVSTHTGVAVATSPGA